MAATTEYRGIIRHGLWRIIKGGQARYGWVMGRGDRGQPDVARRDAKPCGEYTPPGQWPRGIPPRRGAGATTTKSRRPRQKRMEGGDTSHQAGTPDSTRMSGREYEAAGTVASLVLALQRVRRPVRQSHDYGQVRLQEVCLVARLCAWRRACHARTRQRWLYQALHGVGPE